MYSLVELIKFLCVLLPSHRSSESDSKLERNIGFIAEVLVRHIFNLTTKVSPVSNLPHTINTPDY